MQRTALTIFGALLISGSVVQIAAASEHHKHLTKANFARHHSDFLGAYNQMNGTISVISVTPSALYRTDTDGSGFRRADPSWIGDEDPSLHPAD